MKSMMTLIGSVLVVFGLIGFSYKYFTYSTEEKVAEIGSVKVTAEKEKVIVISPLLSGLTLGAGIVLVAVGLSRRR